MSDNTGWVDAAGFDLSVGDYVVYTVMVGRSPYLSFARVIGAVESKASWRPSTEKLRVIGTNPTWSSGNATVKKPSVIQYHERVLAIAPDSVPEKHKKALDEAWEKLNAKSKNDENT